MMMGRWGGGNGGDGEAGGANDGDREVGGLITVMGR